MTSNVKLSRYIRKRPSSPILKYRTASTIPYGFWCVRAQLFSYTQKQTHMYFLLTKCDTIRLMLGACSAHTGVRPEMRAWNKLLSYLMLFPELFPSP